MFDTFAHFTNAFPESALSWEFLYIYFRWRIYSATEPGLYLRLYFFVCASYNGVCINIFWYPITVFVLLCVFMLHNIIVGYNSSWYYVLYLPCTWVFPPLHHCCIFFALIWLLMLYIWLLRYFFVLRMICSLVALHLGNLVMRIYCILFVIPL